LANASSIQVVIKFASSHTIFFTQFCIHDAIKHNYVIMFKIQNEYLNVMKPYQTSFYKKTQKHEKKKEQGTRGKQPKRGEPQKVREPLNIETSTSHVKHIN